MLSPFQDGYEEELINFFRKIPEFRKREAFEMAMERLEYILDDCDVL